MKKYEVSEEFIKEAYAAACDGWKERIKKEFPEVFEANPIIGKWIKRKDIKNDFMAVVFDAELSENMKGYGVNSSGRWMNDNVNLCASYWDDFIEATPEEVKAMLLKEAEKRGYKEGVKIKTALYKETKRIRNGVFFYEFQYALIDKSSEEGSYIFHEGKWAEIINENNEILERIESLQKELEELKERVK